MAPIKTPFELWFEDWVKPPLRYFTPAEFLVKGNANFTNHLNTDPPSELWPNCIQLVKLLDEFRHRIGKPIKLLNVYRSPAYNRAIGGAANSQHMQFKAADFVVLGLGKPIDWAVTLKAMRSLGLFSGGIGVYDNFVHVDVRGTNADWDERSDKSPVGSVLTLPPDGRPNHPSAPTTPTPRPRPVPVSVDLPPTKDGWFIRLLRLLGINV